MPNLLGFFLFVSVLVQSGRYEALPVYKTNDGFVIFHSDAPLELIKASSNELKGKLDPEKKTFAFSIRINSFSGFNSALQKEHFNENYLESSLYPNATFSGKIIEDVDFSINGVYHVRAKGNLLVHGIIQERIIKTELIITDNSINIKSNFNILLADHNISTPKVVHEKLASKIKVEVKADFIPQ